MYIMKTQTKKKEFRNEIHAFSTQPIFQIIIIQKKIVSAAQNNLFFIVKWFKKQINTTEFCT